MSTPPVAHIAELVYRAAFPDETSRATSLHTPAPAKPGESPVQCFVAVKELPVERLVGAAFWRVTPLSENDHDLCAEFEWSLIPSLGDAESHKAFIQAITTHLREQAPQISTIAPSAWLPTDHPFATILSEAGFSTIATRTQHTGQAHEWQKAIGDTPLPEGTQLIQPTKEHFNSLKDLLCGPALSPSELAHGFQTATGDKPSLFDPRLSSLLISADRIIAASLANLTHGHLTIVALAGKDQTAINAVLQKTLKGHSSLKPETLSFQTDDRTPDSTLHLLADRFPSKEKDTLSRYQKEVSS